jgi:hypothetical protein
MPGDTRTDPCVIVISRGSATSERCAMQFIPDRKIPDSFNRVQPAGECIEQEPMHPDDFKAHLGWVTAKRFHELVTKESFA